MERMAHGIVKHKKLVLILALVLLVPSLLGMAATRINYDILTYLPPELDSMIGEASLEDDFNLASTAMITVEGLPTARLLEMKEEMEQVPGVEQVFWLSDLLGPNIPQEMLPASIQQAMFGASDSTMMLVRFSQPAASQSTMEAVKQLKALLRENCFMGGLSVILQDTKALVDTEMPLYILCAVGASLLVLFLAMESTVVPLLFMLGLIFPILYNFGSNYFLGQISYITQALATVLQLGVTMDFSIFLLHRYQEEKSRESDKELAMTRAIVNTFTSITASSLTTIAGFLALCTMRLTLGRDIGIVMAKGVALGVICTITILPALILTFDRAVERRHRVLIPQLVRGSRFASRHPAPILAAFLVIMVPFTLAQSKTDVYYTLFDSLPQDLTGILGTNKLRDDFGMTTSHFILVDDGLTAGETGKLCEELEQVEGITQVISVDEIIGPGIDPGFLPEDIGQLAQSGGYKLILANSAYKTGTDELNAQLETMRGIVKAADSGGVITGEGAMTKDLIEIADKDFKNVNIASIAAVFLIIALSFRSLSVPVLLVASIESAIFINLGIPYFTGSTLPFIASIVIGTIQLGATVDYAILMTTRFREERARGNDPRESARLACQYCSQSILSSGLTFFAATVGVAAISRMELLKSICLLISRGALISMFVIIFILPCLLQLLDRLIGHTTIGWLKKTKNQGEHEKAEPVQPSETLIPERSAIYHETN